MTTPFIAPIPRELVIAAGPDATSFLQSLVSQDLEPVAVGAATKALLLQPQGKLLVDLYAVRREPDTWWCICERGFGPTLGDGLRRFKIRVKVEIELVDVVAVAVRGVRDIDANGLCVVPVEWDGTPAFDVVGTSDEIEAFTERLQLPMVDAATYERARIEAGIPRQGLDIDERTIPQEAGLERNAVSFSKGCFVGQELVCRIDTRGHVNRVLRRLRVVGVGDLAAGDDVIADGKAVGSVTSSVGDVGLGVIRREVELGAQVQAGSAVATVEAAWADVG
jgi:folate-binding protein YgfZ